MEIKYVSPAEFARRRNMARQQVEWKIKHNLIVGVIAKRVRRTIFLIPVDAQVLSGKQGRPKKAVK